MVWGGGTILDIQKLFIKCACLFIAIMVGSRGIYPNLLHFHSVSTNSIDVTILWAPVTAGLIRFYSFGSSFFLFFMNIRPYIGVHAILRKSC